MSLTTKANSQKTYDQPFRVICGYVTKELSIHNRKGSKKKIHKFNIVINNESFDFRIVPKAIRLSDLGQNKPVQFDDLRSETSEDIMRVKFNQHVIEISKYDKERIESKCSDFTSDKYFKRVPHRLLKIETIKK